jgi:hypothetical protein
MARTAMPSMTMRGVSVRQVMWCDFRLLMFLIDLTVASNNPAHAKNYFMRAIILADHVEPCRAAFDPCSLETFRL